MQTTTSPSLQLNFIDETLLNLSLEEDFGFPWKDLTTSILFPNNNTYRAQIISKETHDIIICGIPLIKTLLQKFDNTCELKSDFQDGQVLKANSGLLTLNGKAKTILMLERTILNFLRHLCAIATLTNRFVIKVKDTPLKILDTRKTTPGMRHLEKYAVHCGGGVNHRMGLYDAIMIKDTHIDLLGGIKNTLEQLPEKPLVSVIVEVRSIKELQKVLKYGADKVTRVLLDNMSLSEMRSAVNLCQNVIETEASGNISLENIVPIAETGVQYASIGRLTYGAGHVDLSMQCH